MATRPRPKAKSKTIYHPRRARVENTPKSITRAHRRALSQHIARWASAEGQECWTTNQHACTSRTKMELSFLQAAK